MEKKNTQQHYNEEDIEVLEGLEPVRKRPGMYIGSTSARGLHHLVYEIVDNSIDEVMANRCKNIYISINNDKSITVIDDGSGIPCGIHPKKKIATLQLILTTLHAGGKFGKGGYSQSGGLHGVGSSVVNALSSKLIATVYRDGNIYRQTYEKGIPTSSVDIIGSTDKHGTEITFYPDETIFETIKFNYDTLASRFKESAFLNRKATITLEDKRENKEQINTFHFEGGLKEFVNYINDEKEILHDTVYINKQNIDSNVEVEIAFQYINDYIKSIYSYANNINTIEGGSHLAGFKIGFLKAINKVGKEFDLIKKDFFQDDIEEGLSLVVSVKLQEPQFEGQTKTKLGNSEMRGIVSDITSNSLEVFFTENQEITNIIIEKLLQTQKFRENLKKNKNLEKKKKALLDTKIKGKLADCSSKNPEECEVFIVEGDSAGGSAKQARDRRFQAILSTKGKIINCEKQKIERVLDSNEIKLFTQAIGTGIDDDFNIDKAKYHKIIILCDGDVDGLGHIRPLWLTFIWRYMRKLIEYGYVYSALPPLYKNVISNEEFYTYSESEQSKFINNNKDKKIDIQRYKGLGEMDAEQLWDTTMNPETRHLIQVTAENIVACDKTVEVLMGKEVQPRKQLIFKTLKERRYNE